VCQIRQCLNSCNNHGYCNSNLTCECDPEWISNDCSVRICKNNCSGRGLCINTNFAVENQIYREKIIERLSLKLDQPLVNKFMDALIKARGQEVKDGPSEIISLQHISSEHSSTVSKSDTVHTLAPTDLFDFSKEFKCVCQDGFADEDCSKKNCKKDCSHRGLCD